MGIYYHLDYVGDLRSYKWLLTYNISKVREQMHLAAYWGADRIWIVNVGDLKPMEFAMEFFLTIARDPIRYTKGDLQRYIRRRGLVRVHAIQVDRAREHVEDADVVTMEADHATQSSAASEVRCPGLVPCSPA